MFEWLFNLIYGGIADLFEFINSSTSDIFTLSWVQAFIGLFHNLAWMLFACGLIVAVFDTAIAYESGQANIKNTCLNVLKGFMAASLVTVVPQRLYGFCTNLQGTFTTDLLGNFIGSISDTVADIDPPDVSGNFDQAAWMQSLDSEQQNQIAQMESTGQQIASAMESVGVREQTIKAQLIYISL